MMMFRVNISAKTAITIQLALPKLIATLLMITFSYAIVGLLVDLMYVIFYVFISLLVSQKLILADGILVTAASGQAGALMSFLVNGLFSLPASAIGVLNLILGGPSVLSTAIGMIGLGPLGLIIGIIVFIAVAVSYFRLFWKLLSAILSVIVSLIIAPLILLGNALPGSDTFGTWVRNIFANLSVFPITMILLTFSYILMVQPLVGIGGPTDPNADIAIENNFWEYVFGVKNLNPGGYFMYVPFISPPLAIFGEALGAAPGANFASNAPDAMLALFGVALLLMSSKYVDMVRDALKVPAFKYGGALEEALKVGAGINEKWATKDYSGLPGVFGRKARSVYSKEASASKPSVHVFGRDTGYNIPSK